MSLLSLAAAVGIHNARKIAGPIISSSASNSTITSSTAHMDNFGIQAACTLSVIALMLCIGFALKRRCESAYNADGMPLVAR